MNIELRACVPDYTVGPVCMTLVLTLPHPPIGEMLGLLLGPLSLQCPSNILFLNVNLLIFLSIHSLLYYNILE